MLSVVAESTGYPAEMLAMSMNLEADLGIDSIKRVEILSAVTEKAPELPEIDASAMGALQTLGEIVDFLRAQLGQGPDDEPTPDAQPVPTEDSSSDGGDVGRFAVGAVPAPPVGLTTTGLGSGLLAVTDDGGGIAPALVERLKARGLDARLVDTLPAEATGLIFMGGLADASGPDAAEVVLLDAFENAKALAPQLSNEGGEGLFVTVQDTGGNFGLSGAGDRAWLGGLAGLTKTAAIEWPQAGVKAIDLQRGGLSAEQLADRLVDELIFGGVEREVGLRADGQRLRLEAQPVHEPDGELILDAGDVVVVSGGARGVTAACVIALAKESKARFLLLGRTALTEEPAALNGITADAALKSALLGIWKAEGRAFKPADLGRAVKKVLAIREIEATLAAVEEAGGEARYASVDVTDRAGVSAAIAAVRSDWGRIDALIHGAGVIADKLIADKTRDQVEWVLNTKVGGLRALLAATAEDTLKGVVFFSSVAGRTGNRGQCDYAMANEVLNKVACDMAAHRDGCVVRSIGWGPWAGGMVTPALEAHFKAAGVVLIGLQAGADMLVRSLRTGSADHVDVVVGGAPSDGAIADVGGTATEATYEVWVDRVSQPWLVDHSIREVPVVPVVLALEWAVRAARAFKPHLDFQAIEDIKVLRGILLENWEQGGDRFQLNVTQISNGVGAVLAFQLRGRDGRPHYNARIRMVDPGTAAVSANRAPALELGSWKGKVYGDVLFHGPEFQVIEDIEGFGPKGISGTLSGVNAKGWPGGWHTDPAALDGGLQLAVLWDREMLDGAFLPTGIGAYVPHQRANADGPLRCIVSGKTVGKDRSITDILFTDAEGLPVAELRGVETHRRPSGV